MAAGVLFIEPRRPKPAPSVIAYAYMLRHATGFKLANDGHDTPPLQAYMGHKNIQNTARYTALAPGRFKHFWRD